MTQPANPMEEFKAALDAAMPDQTGNPGGTVPQGRMNALRSWFNGVSTFAQCAAMRIMYDRRVAAEQAGETGKAAAISHIRRDLRPGVQSGTGGGAPR